MPSFRQAPKGMEVISHRVNPMFGTSPETDVDATEEGEICTTTEGNVGGVESDTPSPYFDPSSLATVDAGYIDVATVKKDAEKKEPAKSRRGYVVGALVLFILAVVVAVTVAFTLGGGSDNGNGEPAASAGGPGTSGASGGIGTPTSAPTLVPTTLSPTASPTISFVEMSVGTPAPVAPGVIKLLPSGNRQLLRLLRTTASTGVTTLAARSYGGGVWEAAPPLRIALTCGPSVESTVPASVFRTAGANTTAVNCSTSIASSPGTAWRIESADYTTQTVSGRALAARLLMQATWGPNRAAIDEVVNAPHNGDAASWVAAEMAKPATLHRAYFRERSNPQYPETVNGLAVVSVTPGVFRSTCAAGSRWVRYSLSNEDIDRTITVTVLDPNTTASLAINGVVRTVVPSSTFAAVGTSTTWLVCEVDPGVGGEVTLTNLSVCARATSVTIGNPEVVTPPPSRVVIASANAALLEELSPALTDTKLLAAGALPSELSCDTAPTTGPLYATIAGVDYVADTRVEFLGNTLASPATSFTAHPVIQSSCPNVVKTFVNRETCVTGVTTCAPLDFESVDVTLNTSFFAQYYSVAGRLVYYVTGLRMGSTESPCTGGTTRWVQRPGSSCTHTLSPSTYNITQSLVEAALYHSASRGNDMVRDLKIPANASCSLPATMGVNVTVNGTCWQHVHRQEYNVYDFTVWATLHPGGPVKIGQFAVNGTYNLQFPSWHPMSRWTSNANSRNDIINLGRLGDVVDFATFPTSLQPETIATAIGADRNAASNGDGQEVCGSPGEVPNNPTKGARYSYSLGDGLQDSHRDQQLDRNGTMHTTNAKSIVWSNVVLKSADQLRQRMAWALSQIFVVNTDGVGRNSETEFWVNYYDIFVRHAFGNYRDVMKEVSYSAVMGRMLSFTNTRSVGSSGFFPDENYAREIMQLFSLGQYLLHDNGTVVVDASGDAVTSYDIADVQTLARAWTGFAVARPRGNIEMLFGTTTSNYVDPTRIISTYRDQFPKRVPSGGFLGDGYPICSELPPRAFLQPGATYRYLGTSAVPEKTNSYYSDSTESRTVNLNASTSALAAVLCRSGGGVAGAACIFKSELVLTSPLICDGQECLVDEARVVRVVDVAGNLTVFYEYVRLPCVELSYFANAQLITSRFGTTRSYNPRQLCANPLTPAAQVTCCSNTSTSLTATCQVEYTGERTTSATAAQRCSAFGQRPCNFTWTRAGSPACSRSSEGYFWQPATRPCTLQVQVSNDGMINQVDSIPDVSTSSRFDVDALDKFRVVWDNDSFPTVANGGCSGACAVVGSTCLCNISVVTTAVFMNTSSLPSRSQVMSELSVGAVDPALFPSGTFTRCTTAACTADPAVTIYTRGINSTIDVETVFRVTPGLGSSTPLFFRNVRSTVQLVDGTQAFGFRNPPSFHSRFEKTARDAEHETDALLTYLVNHQNTPPFVANLLIQRLVTSNPSPRYVEAVAVAFKSGSFGSFGTGIRGDLAATVAAVLLDDEARSAVLDNDPLVGKIREPLVKVMHMLRALNYFEPGERTFEEQTYLANRVGEYVWDAPSVFNFFQYDHQPEGPLRDLSMVAPEAELLTAPLVVNLLNSMLSTIRWGLTNCDYGLGQSRPGTGGCGAVYSSGNTDPRDNSAGNVSLTFSPPTADNVVGELDVVLTGGRLASRTADIVTRAYDRMLASSDSAAALRTAAQLLVTSAEFQTLSTNEVTETERLPGVLETIHRDYQCYNDCRAFGELGRQCSACGADSKCCRLNYYSGTSADPDICARSEGTPRFHSCVAIVRNTTTTNSTTTAPTPAPTIPPTQPYKAVVYLLLNGGCDSFNMLIPHSACGGGGYAQYSQVRENVALPLSSLLPIPATVKGPNSTQDCSTYGVHPSLSTVHRLYTDDDALFVANAGTMAEPITKAQYLAKSKKRPTQLFAHNTQQKLSQNLDATTSSRSDGVLGRMVDSLRGDGTRCGMYSIAGSTTVLEPQTTSTYDILTRNGVTQLSSRQRSLLPDIINMSNQISQSVFAETWSSQLVSALYRTTSLGAALDDVTLNTSFPSCSGGNRFACDLRQVAKIMHANRDLLNNERDVFFVQMGGFDVHSDAVEKLASTLLSVDGAISDFESEMKSLGLWDAVTIVQASDFARTLTSNGDGTDHAWGGNSFVLGGAVRGGQIVGQYPNDLTNDGPQSIGRGRLVPSTAWETIWNGVGEWFGVPARDMDTVLPRRQFFPTLFAAADIFDP